MVLDNSPSPSAMSASSACHYGAMQKFSDILPSDRLDTGPVAAAVWWTHSHIEANLMLSQVQHIQHMLLRMIQDDHPELMYPAAMGCLADLEEVRF